MAKYIFVTGGVVSSIGKGITAAAIGRLLKSRNVSLTVQKLDPYLNVDPGTMSPYQHGEVFVTADGAETDLDLGHYERFIDTDLTKSSNVTAGQVYTAVLNRERRGDFLGGTIQVVPHVTNAIKERIRQVAEEAGAEVVVVEVGGTVGDIEGLPFLDAIRQIRNELGRDDVVFVHVTYLPYITSTGELKTKPTQHSVRELRSLGIQPDAIVARSEHPVSEDIKEKISLFCDVPARAVVPMPTVDSIYEVPVILEESGLAEYLMSKLGLPTRLDAGRLAEWREMVQRIKMPNESLTIAIVGKYVQLHDSYLSVKEALNHAGIFHGLNVDIQWVPSEEIEQDGGEHLLEKAHGIVVPGGFGRRGIEGMVRAAQYARERQVPYLGLCLGMQIMVVEFARNVLGYQGANSTEFDMETPYPVIHLMEEQERVESKGGTMRLGSYLCTLVPETVAARAYGEPTVYERHRHRYEYNNEYRPLFRRSGLIDSGRYEEKDLVEICEIRGHPFMVGTQFHAEFRSRPTRPHPLFREFVAAARKVLREGEQTPLPLERALGG
ncbi:MAG: CTP synthase [Chloroflexi bacterium]|nr:CTP synthase [Chloroflexota bacterium]